MKKIMLFLFSAIIFISCNNNDNKRPETALDTGREFIRFSLDGNFKKAEDLLLKDTQNIQLFDRYKIFYKNLPADKRKQYKDAEYNINKYTEIDDSTTTINYSNSYMKKPMDIKIIRSDNVWSVDFKYTYAVITSPAD